MFSIKHIKSTQLNKNFIVYYISKFLVQIVCYKQLQNLQTPRKYILCEFICSTSIYENKR